MFNELIKDILREAFFKNLDISTDIEFQKRLNLIKKQMIKTLYLKQFSLFRKLILQKLCLHFR